MASAIKYDGGMTCALECSDMGKAIAWYEKALGFELLYKVDDMGWCELKCPVERVQIGLSQVEKPTPGAGGATLTFGVKDIDAARATLEGKDVPFDGETITVPDMVRLATFFDPDGNKLMLFQELSPSS